MGKLTQDIFRATQPDDAYFWATYGGAELDLLLFKDGRRLGVEVKRMDAPRVTPSIRTAMEDLGLDHLTVIYPGERRYRLSDQVEVLPMAELARDGFRL